MKGDFKMKKLLSFVLIFAFVCGTSAFAAGTEASEAERVLRLVKERIGSTDEYDELKTNSSTDENGVIYSFDWSSDADGEYKNLYITVSDKGIITNYGKYGGYTESEERISFSGLKNAELEKIVLEFAERLNPSLKGKFKVISGNKNENISGNSRYFQIDIVENGLKVRDSGGSASVKPDGEVTSFWLDYTDGIEYEKAEKLIDTETARERYKEEFGFELCYIRDWDGRADGYKNTLVWLPKEKKGDMYISAVTGEAVRRIIPDYGGFYGRNGLAKSEEMSADSGAGAALSPAETTENGKIAGLISEKEAEKLVRKNKALKLSDKLELKTVNLYKDSYDEKAYLYRLYFSDNAKTSASAAINAETGEITDFSKYTQKDKENGKKLDTDKLIKLAETALKSLAPKYFPVKDENNAFRYSELNSSEGYIEYDRYVNGIRCDYDNISVRLDEETGELLGFNLNRSNESFPSADGVIGEEEAAKIIFEKADFEPLYIFTCSKEGLKKYDKAAAVYILDGNTVIDAFTGKQQNEEPEREEYTDIKGHYAETAVKTLYECGIGFGGSEYKPNEKVLQKDFIAFLSSVFGGGEALITEDYDYEAAYRFAYYRGILTKEQKDGEAGVTRSQAAAMLVSAMGYSEVAEIEGIYKPMFDDVAENTGSISILAGMKVLSGDGNGSFNPDGTLTRADAAVILYNYLSRK